MVDARNSSLVPGVHLDPNKLRTALAANNFADKPCSGMFPDYALPGNWAWEMPAYLTGALNVAIIKEGEEWKKSRALKAFRKAMNIALGPS